MQRVSEQARHLVVAGTCGALLLVSGCSAMADDARAVDACTQYQELRAAADEFRQQDLVKADVDELREKAEHFRDELNQVQAVTEGRLDTAIGNLEASLDDLKQAAVDAGDDVRETVDPLVVEDLEQVAEKWAIVRQAADSLCAE